MDLFDNPMVRNALKSMTQEQLEKYKRLGEAMYGTTNFEDSSLIQQFATPDSITLEYIKSGLRSGLLPEDLNEKEIMPI